MSDSTKLKCYRELLVWQRSMDTVVRCYKASEEFPKHELYGLTSQLRRAIVSVPANIAEGHRYHSGEFLQHLNVAYASLAEVETLLEISVRLEYLPRQRLVNLLDELAEIGRMLNGLIASLRRNKS